MFFLCFCSSSSIFEVGIGRRTIGVDGQYRFLKSFLDVFVALVVVWITESHNPRLFFLFRVWYPERGQYIGYFGQHRMWHISLNPSVPSSPVLPYDITETPLTHLNVKNEAQKKQQKAKTYEYPLIFDADK